MMTAALHVTIGQRKPKSRLRPSCGRILSPRDNAGGALYADVLEDMHPTRCRRQLDRSLLIVNRDDMLKLHHHQPSRGRFECDPAHLAPREIISLM